MVALEDILPTLAEIAGVKPETGDGVSLVPVLRGREDEVRNRLHFEHAPCYSQPQAFHALTDGHMKYIWRPAAGTEQLFDLEEDPQEEHDLASNAAQREELQRWRGLMIQRLASRPEGFSDGERLIPGRRYKPVQPKATRNPTRR